MLKPYTNPLKSEKFIVFSGGTLLLLILIFSWFPRSCPLIRQGIIGCPNTLLEVPTHIATPQENAISSIAHRSITSSIGFFSVTGNQTKNPSTKVDFDFLTDLNKQTVYLQFKNAENNYIDVSLVNSPLLHNLKWPSITNPEVRLYQNKNTYNSIDAFLQTLPKQNSLLADDAAANYLKLQPGSYTPFESVSSLDGFDYIITTYHPPLIDGVWSLYQHTFQPGIIPELDKPNVSGAIRLSPTPENASDFLLGTIHINYIN